jgi:hypothetical protein
VPADEPHEDRHERKGQQHQAGRERVEHRDERDHRDRDDERQDELRQQAGERGLERVHAGHGCGRHLRALGAVERGRVVSESPRHEIEPQAREHLRGRAAPKHLEAPGGDPPRRDHHDEQSERRGDVPQRRSAEPQRGDARDQHRLREDEQRGQEPQCGIGGQEPPHGPRAPEEPRVEHAHG